MAAGSFLYISATTLLPQIRYASHGRRYDRMIGFLCGIGLVVLSMGGERLDTRNPASSR